MIGSGPARHPDKTQITKERRHNMFINGLIIVMLNIVVMGAVLVLDFALFSRFTRASDSTSERILTEVKPMEQKKAQDHSSLQTAA